MEKSRPAKLDGPKTPLRARNRAQRDLDRLIDQIEVLSVEIGRLERELGNSDLYRRDPRTFEDLTARLTRTRVELDTAEQRWLDLAGQLEQVID